MKNLTLVIMAAGMGSRFGGLKQIEPVGPNGEIIADYSVSCIYIRDEIRKMSEDNPDLPLFFGDSKLEYMEETLKLFRQKYKNINNYMEYLGISKEEINLIKHKLFD